MIVRYQKHEDVYCPIMHNGLPGVPSYKVALLLLVDEVEGGHEYRLLAHGDPEFAASESERQHSRFERNGLNEMAAGLVVFQGEFDVAELNRLIAFPEYINQFMRRNASDITQPELFMH